ncbi:histidinol-phosphatase HisJ family protein [Clostridium intestinale]|uniref:histidinol-phosphatase HisJ family protein n=1 Tax=Clostridium intestinale TaxID=36845 RepID=UPI0028EEB40E|nr:histidinol-phosphatase HisJ family protein [Clostridium intestinale]
MYKYNDYHLHSKFSFDSKEDIKNIILKAKDKHIKEICLTEHFSMIEGNFSYGFLDFEEYAQEISKYNSANNDMKIKLGLEIGEGHLRIKEIDDYLKGKPVDFIIGSLHRIDNIGVINHIEEKDIDEVYKSYFLEMYELADTSEYDVLGHMDLVQRYAWNKYSRYNYLDYLDLIDNLLKKVIEKGKGIEINTSILKTRNDFMPKLDIVKRYKELGGEIITVGSDAHSADRVGEGIEYVYEFLKEINFNYIATYDKRKVTLIPL